MVFGATADQPEGFDFHTQAILVVIKMSSSIGI
jgi:hypothetical protein